MLMSAMSLTRTAMRLSCFSEERMWFKSVVLPAPRKPLSTVTGTVGGADSGTPDVKVVNHLASVSVRVVRTNLASMSVL